MNDAQQAAQVVAATGASGKAAASVAAKYTAFGLLAGAIAVASVVMAATTPDKKRDVFVCLVSTLLLSFCGGAMAAIKLGVVESVVQSATAGDSVHLMAAVLALILTAFCCGLPAWCLVGGYFVWADRMRGKTIVEIVEDAKRLWK